MKSSILLALVMLVACSKDDQAHNPFEGEWELSGGSSIDTSLVIYINYEGEFRYYARYSHFGGIVEGTVDHEGTIDGSLKSGAFNVGSMSGNLSKDTGNGEYHTMGQSIKWRAKRIGVEVIE